MVGRYSTLQWGKVSWIGVCGPCLPGSVALCLAPPPSKLIFDVLCLLLQMGACLIVYSSAWTPEPTQLSECRGSQVRGTAQASAETTLEKLMLVETDLSC